MKLKTILAAGTCILALNSCMEGFDEYHNTSFYPWRPNGIVTYADQQADSTRVRSFDSWKLDVDSEWLEVYHNDKKSPFEVKVPAGCSLNEPLKIKIQPNKTGKGRVATIRVTSVSNAVGTITQDVIQLPYLNITTPSVKSSTNGNHTSYHFTMKAEADGMTPYNTQPIVCFTVYADGATLTSDAAWIKPQKMVGFTKFATETIAIDIEKNTSTSERKANLILSSLGISTKIEVVQSGK